MMSNGLSCEFNFAGYSDYWRGLGGRGRGHGAAFAYYGRDTTLRDLVDQWCDDVWQNEYDFEDLPESVTQDDIRDCIVAMLTPDGRADYDSGAICEFSLDWMDCNGIDPDSDEDDFDDCMESPQVIICIDWSDHPDYQKCPDCDGISDPDGVDGLCSDCNDKHYGKG
jgi:hypothetical protein